MAKKTKANCFVMVEFKKDHGGLAIYPQDVETGILLSRFGLLYEDSTRKEISSGGFGPALPNEADAPLQMFDITIFPETQKCKKALAYLMKRKMPAGAKKP